MTAGFYNDEQFGKLTAGFGFTVALSVCLHIIFIALVFLLANDSSSRKITTPIYTVDLFAPEKPITPPKAAALEKQVKNQTEIESKKNASRPAVKEKAIVLKKAQEPSLDEALKKIKERVKKREEEESLNKAIEGLQNKQLEKRIKEIRERVAHKQDVVKSVRTEEKKSEAPTPPSPPLSKGGNRGGAVVKRVEELEEKYAQLVGDLIHDKWNYTEDINKGDAAVLNVRIDKTGHLVESRIEESSGNAMLVESAVRAVEKAAPLFPPLPQEMGKDFVEIGVCFPRCPK